MSEVIELVRNDTRPALVIALTDETTGDVIDVSNTSTVVRLKFREVGSLSTKASITCAKLTVPGSSTPGAAGVVQASWPSSALDAAGDYEGEVEVTFADGSVQTVYDRLAFTVREDF